MHFSLKSHPLLMTMYILYIYKYMHKLYFYYNDGAKCVTSNQSASVVWQGVCFILLVDPLLESSSILPYASNCRLHNNNNNNNHNISLLVFLSCRWLSKQVCTVWICAWSCNKYRWQKMCNQCSFYQGRIKRGAWSHGPPGLLEGGGLRKFINHDMN